MLSSVPFPKYKHPPLAEVVLSAQFLPIEGFTASHFGLMWQKLRADFPIIEQQSPVLHQIEKFGILSNPSNGLRLELFEGESSPRALFVSKDRQEVVQIQIDRLMHNWRAQSDKDEYPSYKTLRPSFEQQLKSFLVFLNEENLPTPMFNQCELTYVSVLTMGEDGLKQPAFGEALTVWPNQATAEWLKEPEFTRLTQQFVIPDANKRPIGRLHLDAHPAIRVSDNKNICKLSLTARLHPGGQDLESVLESLDLGHEWIVKSFSAITTSKMHDLWNK